MTPYIGMPVSVFGGLDNGQFEHAAIVTFVHRNHVSTMQGQVGLVNIRVFLDGSPNDRVLRMVPLMETRERAVNIHTYGVSHAAFLPEVDEAGSAPVDVTGDDGLPPMPAMATFPAYMTEGGVVVQ